MSLTSYQAAPPRDPFSDGNLGTARERIKTFPKIILKRTEML